MYVLCVALVFASARAVAQLLVGAEASIIGLITLGRARILYTVGEIDFIAVIKMLYLVDKALEDWDGRLSRSRRRRGEMARYQSWLGTSC